MVGLVALSEERERLPSSHTCMVTHCAFWIPGYQCHTMSVLVTIAQPPDLTLGSGTESSAAPVTSPIVMWPGNWLVVTLADIRRITWYLGRGRGGLRCRAHRLENFQTKNQRPEERVRGL